MPHYLLDACAILALLNDEPGAEVVNELLDRAALGESALSVNAVNLIEVFYDRIRKDGFDKTNTIMEEIYTAFPVSIIENIDHSIVHEAARLKAGGKMSFADTILVATAICTGSTIVTCDHTELEPVERQERIPFLWIRP